MQNEIQTLLGCSLFPTQLISPTPTHSFPYTHCKSSWGQAQKNVTLLHWEWLASVPIQWLVITLDGTDNTMETLRCDTNHKAVHISTSTTNSRQPHQCLLTQLPYNYIVHIDQWRIAF